jgi:hypothetical protein
MIASRLFFPPRKAQKHWNGIITTNGISCSWHQIKERLVVPCARIKRKTKPKKNTAKAKDKEKDTDKEKDRKTGITNGMCLNLITWNVHHRRPAKGLWYPWRHCLDRTGALARDPN